VTWAQTEIAPEVSRGEPAVQSIVVLYHGEGEPPARRVAETQRTPRPRRKRSRAYLQNRDATRSASKRGYGKKKAATGLIKSDPRLAQDVVSKEGKGGSGMRGMQRPRKKPLSDGDTIEEADADAMAHVRA